MEIIFEILFEIYLELMMFVVPEEKATSKKYRIITIIIATLSLFGILALFAWGIVLIERGRLIGVLPITVAAVLSILQIVAGFILHEKKHK